MRKTGSPLDRLPAEAIPRARKLTQPGWVPPMLATLTDAPFSRKGWLFEPKWDGVRCLVFRDRRGVVRLVSRNEKPLNDRYPEIVAAMEQQSSRPFTADGEIVVFVGTTTSFEKLQQGEAAASLCLF